MSEVISFVEREGFIDRCARCSQCKFVTTPKSDAHASACPSMDFGLVHSYSASGQIIMGFGQEKGAFDYSDRMIEAISSCTMCGACDTACKINFGESVEPLDSLYALRAKLVDDGVAPKGYQSAIDKIRREGNGRGRPRSARADWAQRLNLPSSGGQVLLHIGSVLSYDSEKHQSLNTIVEALKKTQCTYSYLGVDEDSSGAKAFDLGYQKDAREFAEKFVTQVNQSKASTLVTFSSDALSAYRSLYPRMGLNFGETRVLHISEYLCELVEQGQLALNADAMTPQTVAYHDPCKLGRLSEIWEPHDTGIDKTMSGYHVSRAPDKVRFGNNGCYDAPRKLLSLLGAEVTELERNHGDSYCCGAKGGVKETLPKAAILAANERLAEMDGVDTELMVSGCGNCGSHLAAQAQGGVRVLDLLDIVAQALSANTNT